MTEERKGNPNCKHTWVHDNKIICTNPPMGHRICSQCGRVEHTGGEISFEPTFEELYMKLGNKV